MNPCYLVVDQGVRNVVFWQNLEILNEPVDGEMAWENHKIVGVPLFKDV